MPYQLTEKDEILYPYQQKAVDEICESFESVNSVMLQMPTGTGKTHVFCAVIKKFLENYPEKRVLLLVHRNFLIDQAKNRLTKEFEIDENEIGVWCKGKLTNLKASLQLAMIQTFVKHEAEWPKNISLVVVDEAHHSPAKSYKEIISHYKNSDAKLLGVTATPIRLNGEGFNDSFDKLISSLQIIQFIQHADEKQRVLAEYIHKATEIEPDLSSLKIKTIPREFGDSYEDYDENDLRRLMSSDTLMAEIITSYKKHGAQKQAIVFGASVEHAKDIATRFNVEGIKAELIDASTNEGERKQIIEKFTKKEIKILCNKEIFTEGFDCEDIGVVILARPTKSLVLYMQMIGRVIRRKKNGDKALILDSAKLYQTHGLISEERIWSLEEGHKKIEKKKLIRENGEIKLMESQKIVECKELGMTAIEIVTNEESNFLAEGDILEASIDQEDLKIGKLFFIYKGNLNELIDDSSNKIANLIKSNQAKINRLHTLTIKIIYNDRREFQVDDLSYRIHHQFKRDIALKLEEILTIIKRPETKYEPINKLLHIKLLKKGINVLDRDVYFPNVNEEPADFFINQLEEVKQSFDFDTWEIKGKGLSITYKKDFQQSWKEWKNSIAISYIQDNEVKYKLDSNDDIDFRNFKKESNAHNLRLFEVFHLAVEFILEKFRVGYLKKSYCNEPYNIPCINSRKPYFLSFQNQFFLIDFSKPLFSKKFPKNDYNKIAKEYHREYEKAFENGTSDDFYKTNKCFFQKDCFDVLRELDSESYSYYVILINLLKVLSS